MARQLSFSKAMLVIMGAMLLGSAVVSAQEFGMEAPAPSPASMTGSMPMPLSPSPLPGAAFSLPVSAFAVVSSLLFSLVALV